MTVWFPVLVAGLAAPALVPPPSNASVLKSPEEALEESVWALQKRFDAINETLNLFSLENSERARVRVDSVDAELIENRRQEAENELWKGQGDLYKMIDNLKLVVQKTRMRQNEYDENLSQLRGYVELLDKKNDDKSSELRDWVEFLETRVQYNEKELELYPRENTLPIDELEKRVHDLEMLQIKLQIQLDEHAVVAHQEVDERLDTLDEQCKVFLNVLDLEGRIEDFEERLVVLDQRFGDFLIMFRTDARKKEYEAYVEDEKRSKAGMKPRDDVVTNGRLQQVEVDVERSAFSPVKHGSRIGWLERKLLEHEDDIYNYLDNKIREAVHTIQQDAEEKLEMRLAQVNALADILNHNIKRINKIEDTTKGLIRGVEWE